jgi:APA family basic amino acid/polyamine antiporter
VQPQPTDRRRLGLFSTSVLVVASMVGAGVFTTSGFALADLHRREVVLLGWLLGGIVATCGALCYGALARAIPESGGEYTFLSRTVHPLVGVAAGWVSLIAGFTAPIAVTALGLQSYLSSTFALRGDPRWIGTGAIVLAGLLHGLRLRPGVMAQNAAVALKLTLIATFVLIGTWQLPMLPREVLPPESPDLGDFAVTLVWISFAYSGWNAGVYVAGEVRDPERNLPRALLLGTGVVTAAYLALNGVFLYSAHFHQLAGRAEVGAIAADALGGANLRRFLTLIVAIALFTSVSSMVMAGPRVYARMAADGVLPRAFEFEGEVPARSVVLQVCLSVAVVWIAGLRELLSYVGFTLGLCAAATVLGLVRLRLREGKERVPVPGWPVVPALYVGVTLFASAYLAQREPRQALIGAATAALGFVLPRIWKR